MKNRKNREIIIVTVILMCILIILGLNSRNIHEYITNPIKKSDIPINPESGLINNAYFKINSEGKEAENTTNGINEAIKYAHQNNIKNIKLKNGIYEVIGYKNSHYRGIVMKSNVNLDLNRIKNYSTDKRLQYIC